MKIKLFQTCTAVLFVIGFSGTGLDADVQQHLVQKGETLSEIAQKHQVPLKSITQTNSIKSAHRIRTGRALHISRKSLTFEDIWYKVEPGDTLISIARRYNVDWKDLQRTNNIKSTHDIQTGKTLCIPRKTLVPSEIVYQVKPGDTLTGIARRYNVDWKDLQRTNGISSPRKLQVGTRIRIQNDRSFGSPPGVLQTNSLEPSTTLASHSESRDILSTKPTNDEILKEAAKEVAAVHSQLLNYGAVATEEKTTELMLMFIREDHSRGRQIFYDMFKHKHSRSETDCLYDAVWNYMQELKGTQNQ